MHHLLDQSTLWPTEGAPIDTNETEDIDGNEDFFTLSGRYNIVFDKKNKFSQTLLFPFFCMF